MSFELEYLRKIELFEYVQGYQAGSFDEKTRG